MSHRQVVQMRRCQRLCREWLSPEASVLSGPLSWMSILYNVYPLLGEFIVSSLCQTSYKLTGDFLSSWKAVWKARKMSTMCLLCPNWVTKVVFLIYVIVISTITTTNVKKWVDVNHSLLNCKGVAALDSREILTCFWCTNKLIAFYCWLKIVFGFSAVNPTSPRSSVRKIANCRSHNLNANEDEWCWQRVQTVLQVLRHRYDDQKIVWHTKKNGLCWFSLLNVLKLWQALSIVFKKTS